MKRGQFWEKVKEEKTKWKRIRKTKADIAKKKKKETKKNKD